jgi:hypothetical protein
MRPPYSVKQGVGIVGIIYHGVGNIWTRGLAKAALVIGKDFEMLGNRRIKDIG